MTKQAPLFTYTLRLADDALVLGHRLSEWCGHAPVLEEDLALGNMALDLIGQARSLYAYAGEVEGRGRDEDALAYRRDAGEYRNILLVEQPNGDFAASILRQLLYAAFAHPYFEALTKSKDATLSAVAAKSVKELAYHVRHAGEWTIRLGDGTEESHRRAQEAAGDPPWEVDLSGKVVLCFGGEEKGLRSRTRQLCDRMIGLPMRGRVGSLNIATSAAAVLYEAVRQRTSS